MRIIISTDEEEIVHIVENAEELFTNRTMAQCIIYDIKEAVREGYIKESGEEW